VTVDQVELLACFLMLVVATLVGYDKLRFAMPEPAREKFRGYRAMLLIGAICSGLALAGSLAGLA
jgi:hypothetical protein